MKTKKDNDGPGQRNNAFHDCVYDCYGQEYFHEMLVLERKRSERSGRPFLVMTLDFKGIAGDRKRFESIKVAVKTISQLTRSTDIRGWYENGVVMGVIFTEMNNPETGTLREKIERSFSEEQLAGIRISFYRFPGDGKPGDPGGSLQFTFYPDMPRKERSKRNARVVKRIIDVLGSIAGILVFSPFFVLIALGIKMTSRGPVFFRQKRIGQYEKQFVFLKFRSMYDNSDPRVHREFVQNFIANKPNGNGGNGGKGDGEKVYKITKDSRVTPFGLILRKTSLDELPQLFNVLQGNMSLVGPRPPILYELEKYDTWHRRRVLEVKPGITGLWQVMGRSSTTFDEMVRLDLRYATNWSLGMDMSILLRTPMAVLGGKGAY